MAGNRRIIVGEITQGKLRGKALEDALARELTAEDQYDAQVKKEQYGKPKKK